MKTYQTDCASGDGTSLTVDVCGDQITVGAIGDYICLNALGASSLGAALQAMSLEAVRDPSAQRTNQDCIDEFGQVLRLFKSLTGIDPDPDADGPETALSDLLAHALHYCDEHGLIFEECLHRGRGHYVAETAHDAPKERRLA